MERSKGMTMRRGAKAADKSGDTKAGRGIVVGGNKRITVYPAGRLSLGQAVLVILEDRRIFQYETFWDTVPQFDRARWELMAQRGAEWVRGELPFEDRSFSAAEKVCPHSGSDKARETVRKAIDGGKARVVAIEPLHQQCGSAIKIEGYLGVFGNVLCKTCGATMAPGTLRGCYGLKESKLVMAGVDSVQFERGTFLTDADGDYILAREADPSRQLREESAEAERGRGILANEVNRGLRASEYKVLMRRAESVAEVRRKPWDGLSPATERSADWRDPRGECPALLTRFRGVQARLVASDFGDTPTVIRRGLIEVASDSGDTPRAPREQEDDDEFGSPLSAEGLDFSTPKARLQLEAAAESEHNPGERNIDGAQQKNEWEDREDALRLFTLVGLQSERLENIERLIEKSEEESRTREE